MRLDVSCEIQPFHSHHSLVQTSGTIALDIKDGDGSYGQADSTSLSVSGVRSEAERRPKSFV